MDLQTRFATAELMATHYAKFDDFAEDGMAFLGFPLTDMQRDIAQFMQSGPRLRMVMAQRGEAKSTLAALYAVWRIIQRPSTRVLIVSGGEKQASEVAFLVIRLITTWDILEYLRPDKQAGDRASIEGFDVHYTLKGLEKAPSVACVGITAQLQGKRADLLIPDDIETTKNGLTANERGKLIALSKEFSSICTHGDILYLGTPQTKDSIYNTLPGRGFCIRIWPGRFPNDAELEKYGDRLAPFLIDRMQADPSVRTGGGIDGTRGKPADPQRYTEETLVEKELDQGPEGFQLQYMLDTSLADEARLQLRLSDLVVANFDWEQIPEIIQWQAAPKWQYELPRDFPIPMARMYTPVAIECAFVKPKETMMYIDPAGGGADELGYAVSTAVGPYIHVLDCGGLKGGLTDSNAEKLINVIREFRVKTVIVERNMGHGLFEINLRAILSKHRDLSGVGVPDGEYSTGQKERRIIDSLVSAMQRHRVVIHPRVFESDAECGKQHSLEKRMKYSVFHQLSNITTDRNSLEHDDRLEALAGAVRYWKAVLVLDEEKAAKARRLEEFKSFMDNPLDYDLTNDGKSRGIRRTIHKRRY